MAVKLAVALAVSWMGAASSFVAPSRAIRFSFLLDRGGVDLRSALACSPTGRCQLFSGRFSLRCTEDRQLGPHANAEGDQANHSGAPNRGSNRRSRGGNLGAEGVGGGRGSKAGKRGKRRVPGTTRKHIMLNRQILETENESELSALITAHHGDFNGVNIASAYIKLVLRKFWCAPAAPLDLPHTRRSAPWTDAGVPVELAREYELALAVLELEMTKNMSVFGARECSNLLHALAKSRRQPCTPALMPSLHSRVEEAASDLAPQGIANILWSYAQLGMRPGAGVLDALTRRSQV
jgi:hypothetical protein